MFAKVGQNSPFPSTRDKNLKVCSVFVWVRACCVLWVISLSRAIICIRVPWKTHKDAATIRCDLCPVLIDYIWGELGVEREMKSIETVIIDMVAYFYPGQVMLLLLF